MAAIFNGTDSSLDDGDNLGFERTQTAAWSLWYKAAVESPTALEALLQKQRNSAPFDGWAIHREGNTSGDPLRIHIRNDFNNQIHVLFPIPNDTKWHHIAVSYDGSSGASGVLCWVDGELQTPDVQADNLASSILNTIPVRFGARTSDDAPLAGSLANAGMWIDLDVGDFATAVPQLSSGASPANIASIVDELEMYQPLITGVDSTGFVGPNFTIDNVTFDNTFPTYPVSASRPGVHMAHGLVL